MRSGKGADAAPDESSWPERLRQNVRSLLRHCGISHEDWVTSGYDVHHIVAVGLAGATGGRAVLARWSIGVHSIANAAIVPRSFHRGHGLHRAAFLQVVNQRMISADMFAEALSKHSGMAAARLIIIKTIQQIGNELVLQSGDVVAIRLQAALQGMVTKSPGSGGSGESLRSETGRGTVVRDARRLDGSARGADRVDVPVFNSQRHGFHVGAGCPG